MPLRLEDHVDDGPVVDLDGLGAEDDVEAGVYPMPMLTAADPSVHVGRVRAEGHRAGDGEAGVVGGVVVVDGGRAGAVAEAGGALENLAPLRRVIPLIGMMDITPIVALLILQFIQTLLQTFIAGMY